MIGLFYSHPSVAQMLGLANIFIYIIFYIFSKLWYDV